MERPDSRGVRGPVGAARWALARLGDRSYQDPASAPSLVCHAYNAVSIEQAQNCSLAAPSEARLGLTAGTLLIDSDGAVTGLAAGADWVVSPGPRGLCSMDLRATNLARRLA